MNRKNLLRSISMMGTDKKDVKWEQKPDKHTIPATIRQNANQGA